MSTQHPLTASSGGAGARDQAGFSLIEVMIAMSLLMFGLFALAQVFYFGLAVAMTSTPNLVAREKAREAIESVHTARDTHTVRWSQIRNDEAPETCPEGMTGNGGGVFVAGDNELEAPGPDGLVGTSDDDGHEMTPGPDGILGTPEGAENVGTDDVPLLGYSRQIEICDIDTNPDLRRIVVTISYDGSRVFGQRRRSYRLVTFISRFS